MRLNLGAGESQLPGYDNTWDAASGKKAYPLDLADGVADEIRCSHLLEHFGHNAAGHVMQDWVRVLKPGGLLKIAVPDFEKLVRIYSAGGHEDLQAWICGGQMQQYDAHLTQYDWPLLSGLMRQCGLAGIHRWQDADPLDTSSLPISLNVAGWKRPESWPKVNGAMSHPRLGFMDTVGCISDALAPMGIQFFRQSGAFWGPCITRAIRAAIDDGAQWILTLDYDSIFGLAEVQDLIMFAMQNPEADALIPLQMNRWNDTVMAWPKGMVDAPVWQVERNELECNYYPLDAGHFGCSLFRASAFEKLATPWFHSKPGSDDNWGDDRQDDDMWFWQRFREAGCKAFLCPRVVLGHMVELIVWPDREMNRQYQMPKDWWASGKPRNVWR